MKKGVIQFFYMITAPKTCRSSVIFYLASVLFISRTQSCKILAQRAVDVQGARVHATGGTLSFYWGQVETSQPSL